MTIFVYLSLRSHNYLCIESKLWYTTTYRLPRGVRYTHGVATSTSKRPRKRAPGTVICPHRMVTTTARVTVFLIHKLIGPLARTLDHSALLVISSHDNPHGPRSRQRVGFFVVVATSVTATVIVTSVTATVSL